MTTSANMALAEKAVASAMKEATEARLVIGLCPGGEVVGAQ